MSIVFVDRHTRTFDISKLDPCIHQLCINGYPLECTDIKALALLVETTKTLKILSLTNTPLWDQGLARLARAIKMNTSLTTLQLIHVDISSFSDLADALFHHRSIAHLNLSNNQFSFLRSIYLMADVVKLNTCLRSISIVGNRFDSHESPYLFRDMMTRALKTNLTLIECDIDVHSGDLTNMLRINRQCQKWRSWATLGLFAYDRFHHPDTSGDIKSRLGDELGVLYDLFGRSRKYMIFLPSNGFLKDHDIIKTGHLLHIPIALIP